MRLRNWIAVTVTVILLLGVGILGLVVNRSALQAADAVHRSDSQALVENNARLIYQQLAGLTSTEMVAFLRDNPLTLDKKSTSDSRTLGSYLSETVYFSYALTLTDANGQVLTGVGKPLPAANDPGYTPMRQLLAQGTVGYSSLMFAPGRVPVIAVAVPITIKNARVAYLAGYIPVRDSQLQKYVASLTDLNYRSWIVDSTGHVAFANDNTIGAKVDPAIIAAKAHTSFIKYRSGGTKMIAVVNSDVPGGWKYVRAQTQATFDGAVHTRSQTINLLLLAMLLIGVVGITILGYRTMITRRRADERFRALFQHAPDMVAVLDDNGLIQFASPSAAQVLSLKPGSLTGTSVFELVHPDDRERMLESFGLLMSEQDAVERLQCRVLTVAGDPRWFEFTASNQSSNPSLNGVVINARDVSETRAFHERLAHEAAHDALTGLPNRRRMHEALGASLQAGSVGVLFVDLDGFKPVNDAYGHEAGDELLRQVATRLGSCVRAQDVLARVGGDEFVVLMPGITDRADAEAMAVRVSDALSRPFLIAGHTVTIGASVGVHLATSAADPDQALRAADHAMYEIKRAGGGRLGIASASASASASTGRHRAPG
jgi:diguanylate cyclase (GGDEF)-like protein/PAS domain S-box-containing protein